MVKEKINIEGVINLIDYLTNECGAKKIEIDTDNGFAIYTDVVPTKEQFMSEEFKSLLGNLTMAIA